MQNLNAVNEGHRFMLKRCTSTTSISIRLEERQLAVDFMTAFRSLPPRSSFDAVTELRVNTEYSGFGAFMALSLAFQNCQVKLSMVFPSGYNLKVMIGILCMFLPPLLTSAFIPQSMLNVTDKCCLYS